MWCLEREEWLCACCGRGAGDVPRVTNYQLGLRAILLLSHAKRSHICSGADGTAMESSVVHSVVAKKTRRILDRCTLVLDMHAPRLRVHSAVEAGAQCQLVCIAGNSVPGVLSTPRSGKVAFKSLAKRRRRKCCVCQALVCSYAPICERVQAVAAQGSASCTYCCYYA